VLAATGAVAQPLNLTVPVILWMVTLDSDTIRRIARIRCVVILIRGGALMRLTTNTMSMTCLLALLVMLVQGCASDHPVAPKLIEPKRMIKDIMIIRSADSLTVVVQGDQPLFYTFMQQDSPQALVIQFADTGFDRLEPVYSPPDNFAVHSIQTVQIPENGMEARVVLGLKGSTSYQLVSEENSLKVVFTKTTPPAQSATSRRGQPAARQRPPSPASQTAPASGILKEVDVAFRDGGVAIHMRVDGNVRNYKTFTIDDPLPARIILDLVGLRSVFHGEQKIPVEGNIVKLIRHFGHPDKVRVVVETEKAYLKDFSVEPVENGIVLKVGASTKKEN